MQDKYIIHEKRSVKDIREFIEDLGERYQGRVAYSYRLKPHDKESVKKNYETLRDDVRALASEFISRGLAGKHIVLIGKLSYNWVLTYYATLCIGSVLCPLDPEWTATDLADTATRADIGALVIESRLADKADAIAAQSGVDVRFTLDGEGENTIEAMVAAGSEKFLSDSTPYYTTPVDPDKLSLLVFTSGTTGKGKGVMLSQTNFITCLQCVIPYMDFADKTMGLLPPHHTYGSSVSIFGHNFIGTEVYISAGQKYLMKEMAEEKPGHLVLVPLYLETFYRKLTAGIKEQGKEKLVNTLMKVARFFRLSLKTRRKLFNSILCKFGGNLKMLISGGAAINQDIINFFEGLGIQVLNGYGITECAPIIAVNYSKHVTHGTVGHVLSCNEVKIADVNEDGEGEICVKGTNVMLGYYKDEAQTKDAFDEDGYFKTGDFGKMTDGGVLAITGRKKNLIILSNGKNVYPEEIEGDFISVPGLLDIIVYEGQSKRGLMYNAIVAEIFPDYDYLAKNGIEDAHKYFMTYVNEYNRTAVSYKKIGLLKIRTEDFPKNTLRKIMRFKLDMTID